MLNSATVLMRIQTDLTGPTRRDMATDTLNRRNEWLLKLQDRVEQFVVKEKTTLANRTLSEAGKAEQGATQATDALPTFAFLGNIVQTLETTEARFEKQLLTVEPAVKDELLQFLRAQEIRSGLRDADQGERTGFFLKAAEENREEILWAMLNSPTGPMVSEDIKTRALTERAKRLQPEAYEQFKQNTLLREYVSSLRDHVALWLRGLGVDPKAIHGVLGGTVASAAGTPDGRERLEGSVWAQAIAAGA